MAPLPKGISALLVLWFLVSLCFIVLAFSSGCGIGYHKEFRTDGKEVQVRDGYHLDKKDAPIPDLPPIPPKPSKSGNPTLQICGGAAMILCPVAGYLLGAMMAGIIAGVCGAALLGVDRFFAMYTWVMFVPFGLVLLWLIYQLGRVKKAVPTLMGNIQFLKDQIAPPDSKKRKSLNATLKKSQEDAGVQTMIAAEKKRMGL